MKTNLVSMLSLCSASTLAFTPPAPPPPAIERLAKVNTPAKLENLQGRAGDFLSSSAVSSARLSKAIREDKVSTLIPLQRPMHQQARKILNPSQLFGAQGPQPEDVVQGESGDCYLLAVLAAMAKHQPDTLKDAFIKIDGSGDMHGIQYKDMVNGETLNSVVFDTSSVHDNNRPLYAGDSRPQDGQSPTEHTPEKTTDAENSRLSTKVQDALSSKKVSWVKLFENWFADVNERYELLNSNGGFEGISRGGWAAIPYKLITGKGMDIIAPKNLKEFQELMDQADDGKIIILISNSKTFSEYYFPGTHAYAVLGHEDGSSDIYNPHGRRVTFDDKLLFDNTIRVIAERPDQQTQVNNS